MGREAYKYFESNETVTELRHCEVAGTPEKENTLEEPCVGQIFDTSEHLFGHAIAIQG